MKLSLTIETEEIDDLKMYACARDAFATLNAIDNSLRNFLKYGEASYDDQTSNFLHELRHSIHETLVMSGVV